MKKVFVWFYVQMVIQIKKNLKILNWDQGFFRKDIGYKVIDL